MPLNLGICLPTEAFVFKVAEIFEELDCTGLFHTYLRKWRRVNPVTMLEILVLGYINRKYSSREIEKACKTDIRFTWLLNGEPTPSDSTIARFMRGHLAKAIEVCELDGGKYPFGEKMPRIGIKANLARVNRDYKDFTENVADVRPRSVNAMSGAEEKILIPYDCAKLRMTELPTVKMK